MGRALADVICLVIEALLPWMSKPVLACLPIRLQDRLESLAHPSRYSLQRWDHPLMCHPPHHPALRLPQLWVYQAIGIRSTDPALGGMRGLRDSRGRRPELRSSRRSGLWLPFERMWRWTGQLNVNRSLEIDSNISRSSIM